MEKKYKESLKLRWLLGIRSGKKQDNLKSYRERNFDLIEYDIFL